MMLLILSAALAAPSSDLVSGLTGKWVPVDDGSLQQRLDTSLERTLSQMTWAFRPFARPLLRKQMTVCPALNTKLQSHHFRALCPNGSIDLDRLLDNSEPGFTGEDGDWYEVTMQVEDNAIAAVFTSEATVYTVWYIRSEKGLDLRTRIENSRLAEPLDWTVPYLPAR